MREHRDHELMERCGELWSRPADEVLKGLGVERERGLSAEEARERLLRHGRNALAAARPKGAWTILVHTYLGAKTPR